MKKKRVTIYLDDRQLKFIASDKPMSKRSMSATVRYALNKLQAEYDFDKRDFAPIEF